MLLGFLLANTLSGAIALRIFFVGSPLQGSSSRPHWLIIFTLVESCALYTITIVATLTTFLSDCFGQYVAMDSIVPMVVSVQYILLLPSDCHTNLHIRSREFPSLLSCFRSGSMSAPQISPVLAAMVVPRRYGIDTKAAPLVWMNL